MLNNEDIKLLIQARYSMNGDLVRNRTLEAFKRAGANVRAPEGKIQVEYKGSGNNYVLPMGPGFVDLSGRHRTFRNTLRLLATELLQKNCTPVLE